MTRNKIFIYFLFMALSNSAFAGCNCDSLIIEVYNILKLKHNYEASVMYQQKKKTFSPVLIKYALKMDSLYKIVVEEPAVSLKKYTEKIMTIRLNKSTYISCIESELANKNNSLMKPLMYDYRFPMDSYIGKENMMNKQDFLKIFKYFIFDLDNNTLPPRPAGYGNLRTAVGICNPNILYYQDF
jgi:hypothetical protein